VNPWLIIIVPPLVRFLQHDDIGMSQVEPAKMSAIQNNDRYFTNVSYVYEARRQNSLEKLW
jgi:hypothetical protein